VTTLVSSRTVPPFAMSAYSLYFANPWDSITLVMAEVSVVFPWST
jgi:hypothetical protein